MDFDFSQEQRLLADSARDFLKRDCSIKRVRELMATETAFDDALWSALAEQGWTGMTLAEEVGGLGLTFVDQCVVFEEMGRASVPGPFFSTFWASALLRELAPSHPLLADIAAGEKKATVAWLEPGSSWDASSIKLAGRKGPEGVRLDGRKHAVTDALAADVILTVFREGESWGVAAVPARAEGVNVQLLPSMDETRKLASVSFNNTAVGRDAIFTGIARESLDRANDFAAVALCAELVGLMQNLMEMTLDYARSRQQFERPIGIFQAIQHQCADMLLFTESGRSATYHAAWALDEKTPEASRAAAVAKVYCSEAARQVANRACQVHGGIGFTWEHDLHLYYKRAKFSEVLLGDPTFHRERVASFVLDTPSASSR